MSSVYVVTDFGACADGKTSSSFAIERAIRACADAGGGTVYIPAGDFLTGSIQLYSNVRLYLEHGAQLLFAQEESSYPLVDSRWEGVDCLVYRACIYACNAENVTIEGGGTVNGQGEYWWRKHLRGELAYPRPRLVCLQDCKHAVVRGVKLVNSPSWTLHPLGCQDVLIDGVSIINPPDSPNTDGINPESCDGVRIQGCYISVGDDCLTLKSGTQHARNRIPCQNITITGCIMRDGHGGIVIGSEMSGDVRNVVVCNCVFHRTDRGIRIKSRRGRGGVVEDILVSNVIMDEVSCPFVMNLYYFCGPDGHSPYVQSRIAQKLDGSTPQIRRIRFSGITAKNCRSAAGFVYGLAERPIEDIGFENVLITMGKGFAPELPAMLDDCAPAAQAGFFAGFARGLTFSRVEICGAQGPAFHIENSYGVCFESCRTSACTGETFFLKNVETVCAHNLCQRMENS